jgi:hypothetical protein
MRRHRLFRCSACRSDRRGRGLERNGVRWGSRFLGGTGAGGGRFLFRRQGGGRAKGPVASSARGRQAPLAFSTSPRFASLRSRLIAPDVVCPAGRCEIRSGGTGMRANRLDERRLGGLSTLI